MLTMMMRVNDLENILSTLFDMVKNVVEFYLSENSKKIENNNKYCG